jgi:hypothetical protein
MGFLSAFAPRLALPLWFAAGFTFALPTHHGRSLAIIHRSIRVPIPNVVVGRDSSAVIAQIFQSRADTESGSASDGAGFGFDIPAVIWLSFALALGLFLTVGGVRLWRVTTALAIGLVFAFCGESSLPSFGGFGYQHWLL